ncbi:MAG: 3-phosphoserine/phosphohydroxythreonine transaminase, partial [Leptospiraceae bacterium]|nr:3-phosphoserine/phosphohydroxythreonine transaminase [Leptospiraceae bacterium]
QFSSVPLNFLQKGETGAYSLTGVWAVKAEKEARNLGYQTVVVYDGKETAYTTIPNLTEDSVPKEAKYLYITSNNTIYGTRYLNFPKCKRIPLIADMTSELLSRKINVEDFGYIFAGAQKNIGPAGLTIGIVRKDLLEIPKKYVPILLDYKVYFENKSLYNTPPTYLIYLAGLVFEWCLEKGGLEELEKINEEKANMLYNFLDSSSLYYAPVKGENRSIMNVVFHLKNKGLEDKFIKESEQEGLIGLKGHRDAGGMRASIYNAMPIAGVKKLIEFMKNFEQRYFQ